ncbi:G-I-Y Y-I-G endonuclease [Mycobacterium phage Martik]|uniref:G-I-Y-Y-I-G endonuclease n=5 Tax=Cheoctovirus TaxID=1623281 RepID=A0A2P1JR47_9CAUD|nr:endonuclease [Mycobacterium phage Drago]YP_009202586.1 endonuclease [Mycobacterium phage Phatniss]YP_009955182.1 endonuclease [Mycobacterium phage Burwell21]YP_655064.1 endonuclease [Mycobacterium phage Llij]AVO21572.1 G-I-Y-Y-I-G endonuclease [Mycobacterium phage UncleRicky]QGJ89575.1 G-I-Y-Y-I-G endonuclease [Mycobacterium phage Enby]QGJ91258.1 G-I-Y-Y-I-G endonuclease [Mycobacterium phage Lorde]UAJ16058.1 G-I-Y Y-I-G endonuclease [Mycobacterium phage DirtMcgirt]UVK58912.1 G-I-Y Y-I-G 
MAHVLYRFYSATGQLLYVGITMNPPQRFKAHRDSKDWWSEVAGISIENYNTREELENAERRAIQVEHPLHNVVRAKPKVIQDPFAESDPKPQPEHPLPDSLTDLFSPEPTGHVFGGLFGRSNVVRDRQAEARRARWDAIYACDLCDHAGYRGKSVCDHVEHRSGRAREAQRQVQRDRLQVIPGGDS